MDWNKVGAIGSFGSFILAGVLFAVQIWPYPQWKAEHSQQAQQAQTAKVQQGITQPTANTVAKSVVVFLIISLLLSAISIHGAWRKPRAAAEDDKKNSWPLNIKSAKYGVGGNRYKDVTALVRAPIKNNKLHLLVSNNTLLGGADPFYGEVKHLLVQYSLGNGPIVEVIRREQDYLELPEGNEPTQPQDDPLCKALKEIAEEDAQNTQERVRKIGQRVEFHFAPGLDPYIEIFIELLNASVFQVVTYGEVEGHTMYGGQQLPTKPQVFDSTGPPGPTCLSLKHGESGTMRIKQFVSAGVAERMWNDRFRNIAVDMSLVRVAFKMLLADVPQKFTLPGPRITIDEAADAKGNELNVEILAPLDGAEVGLRRKVKGSVRHPNSKVQVLVHAANDMWYLQGQPQVDGSTWNVECWFGNINSGAGEDYQVIAIADGNIKDKFLPRLPEVGTKSNVIKVRRTLVG